MPLRIRLSNEYKGYHVSVGMQGQTPVVFIDEEEVKDTDLLVDAAWKEDDTESFVRLFAATLRYIDANPHRYPDPVQYDMTDLCSLRQPDGNTGKPPPSRITALSVPLVSRRRHFLRGDVTTAGTARQGLSGRSEASLEENRYEQ